MKDLFTQLIKVQNYSGYCLIPASNEDIEVIKGYQPNQVLKTQIRAIRKQRSYKQLKAYFAICRKVAENTDNPDFNTSDKVDMQARVKLGWIKHTIVIDKRVQFIPRSISYKEMKHLQACSYFTRAFELFANFLGVTVEELISNSK